MSLEFVRKLPTPTEIREQYPLSARATEIKKQRDAEIAKVFTGDSDKFLVIVGPCSADNEDAVLEYNHRLAKVADKVSDKLIIIPRVYTNKPRTTGEGYKGDIKVAVVIENKKIQYILIMKNEDDKAYFNRAKSIATEVVKKQKAKVDTVSGATYSSKGILEAIKNALKDAKKKSTKKSKKKITNKNTKTEQETTEVTTTINVSEGGSGVYKDGTYTVTGICKPNGHGGFEAYTMSAQVTILNDRVIAISYVKGVGSDYSKSNDWYIKRAANGTSKFRGVVTQIVGKGTLTSIDTVSGATCSSETIIELVKKALENAKNN